MVVKEYNLAHTKWLCNYEAKAIGLEQSEKISVLVLASNKVAYSPEQTAGQMGGHDL